MRVNKVLQNFNRFSDEGAYELAIKEAFKFALDRQDDSVEQLRERLETLSRATTK